MSLLFLFLIGLFTASLCSVFLYVSIHEMRRLNPDRVPHHQAEPS